MNKNIIGTVFRDGVGTTRMRHPLLLSPPMTNDNEATFKRIFPIISYLFL